MRLAAMAKGGYYPTPPRVVDMIAGLIRAPYGRYGQYRETLRILDPCCGAGDAVAQLAESLTERSGVAVETYGVELHRDRSETAEERLTRFLSADLFAASIANGVFGLLYLNPPYDWDAADKRVEQVFLTTCTRYLAEDGVLAFIVPRQRLAVSARYLASHYRDLHCWAFPHPEREQFDQVVLVGCRKADPSPNAPPTPSSRSRTGPRGNRRSWSRTPTPASGFPRPLRETSCSPPARWTRWRLRRRPGVRGCGPARRSPTPSGPPGTTAPGP